MAITDIRKLNVRSPYFVEVVDEYINLEPPAEPPVEPEPEEVNGLGALPCGSVYHIGGFSSIFRFTLDTTDKELGVYSFTIANAVIPVKFRAYTKGDTPPAYTTIGLDNYANEWLAATGEDATSLSTEAANPNGVSRDFIYTTDAATAAISKDIIVDLYAPIPTINNMEVIQKTCQPQIAADAPASVGYVTVITVAVHSMRNIFQTGLAVPTNAINITLNGTAYGLSEVDEYSGVRLITHDSTPNYTVLSNDNPYGHQSYMVWQKYWSYDTVLLGGAGTSRNATSGSMIPQEITNVLAGINELEIGFASGVGGGVNINIANHPVTDHSTISGRRVINHLGASNTPTELSIALSSENMGNIYFPSPESIKVQFSGVNEQNLVINSAKYYHEVQTNEGDSVDQITNLVVGSRWDVYTSD